MKWWWPGRRRELEERLDEEMRFHLDQQTAKHERAGMSAAEARRQALVQFGGGEQARERTRDEVRFALLEDSWRDLRHGLRVLARSPGFTAAALLTLALGIGATSAIFSVVRTVMLEPLPYRDPDRLVAVWETNRGATVRNVIAPANFVAWRERTKTLEHLGMAGPATLAMVVNGVPDNVSGMAVSYDVFPALGVQPALGRAYTADEDLGGSSDVIILSHEFWQRRLGGRADVVGLTLTADGRRRTVIGVMPPRFTIVGQQADFFIPYGLTLEQLRAVSGRGSAYGLARLRDGVSIEQATSEMRGIYDDLAREFPQRNASRTVILLPLQEQLVGEIRPALLALIGAVALVLLVACVNVANLLLARSAAREREIGLRAALGAGRGRLVRQMLTESLVLAVAGGGAGLMVASWCQRGLRALIADRVALPRLDQMSIDPLVIGFTMITALATGVLFGLVPALVATSDASDALREGGRHGGGRRLRRVLNALVIAEVALSLVLLAGAGLLMRSFLKLQNIDPGFRAEGVLAAGVQLPAARYTPAQADVVFRETLTRAAALPGVEHAAGATCVPMPGQCIGTSVWRVDQAKPAAGQLQSGDIRPITPDFFKTLGIPPIAGRDFAAADTVDAPPVAIVSEAFAKSYFPSEDPIGRQLRINATHANGREDLPWTIVGVVHSIKGTLEGADRRTIYVPMPQMPALGIQLFLRTAQPDVLSLAPSVTRMVHAIEPEAPVDARTLEDVVGGTIARPRVMSVLVGVFALVALTLAAVGVYGVMAYSVRERTREIGVRMALGASAMSVFRLVLGQALRLVLIGIAIGLIAAASLTRLIERLLFDVAPLDPWTFALTALLLVIVASIASYVPARRGMQMTPTDALRID